MGLGVPPWAAKMFHVVTGDAWPVADEDQIRDVAQLWFDIAAELRRFAPEVADSANYLVNSGAVSGNAQLALRNTVAIVTGDGSLTMEKLAAGFEEMGQFLHGVALQVQYMKIIVIEELIILAAEVVYLIAMIPWTFGASAAGVAALQFLGREFATRLFRQFAISIVTSEVLQVGLDAIAQLAQMGEGWRGSTEWDWDLTKSAAITGAIGGVLGPVFQGLGHFPAHWLGRAIGRDAADVAGNMVKGAGHEYVTDGTSGFVQNGHWLPDTFSLTAGAIDEGVTSVAGIGRRNRAAGMAPFGAPSGGVSVPGPIELGGQDPVAGAPDDPATTPAAGAQTSAIPPPRPRTIPPPRLRVVRLPRLRVVRSPRLRVVRLPRLRVARPPRA